MTIHNWLGFLLASFVMGLIPGPGVTSIVGYAIGSGRRTALASAAGMAVGNAVAITVSLAGVGALLAASTLAFSLLKWAGVLYLTTLGVFTLRGAGNRSISVSQPIEPVGSRIAFLNNVAVGIFHPKTIAFFVSFVPQFISPAAGYLGQAALLAVTFCGIVLITDTIYALVASSISQSLRRPAIALWSRRASGGVLIAAGVMNAAARR